MRETRRFIYKHALYVLVPMPVDLSWFKINRGDLFLMDIWNKPIRIFLPGMSAHLTELSVKQFL